jgi:integrase
LVIVAYIERRQLEQRDKSGRIKSVARYKVRYRDAAGRPHSETKRRLVDAERRKAEIELDLANGLWRDPQRGQIRLEAWAAEWIKTRHDLRLTTRTRLEITLKVQVLPKFGTTPLVKITNAAVRGWVAEMLSSGLSAATVRKAVFALRQCLDAAIADNRLVTNPAISVPLPSERLKPPRFLSQTEVELLVGAMPDQYKALVLVGAYAGLRWGEAAGLTRASIDVLQSRIRVITTAVEVRGHVSLRNEPKTARSKRTVPVARSVMRRLEEHLMTYVGPEPDALVFTAPRGGPLARSLLAVESGSQPSRNLGYRKSHSMGFDTASSRYLWRLAAMSARCRNGLATTAWPSPLPATAVCSRTARTQPSTDSTPCLEPLYRLPKGPLSRELRN